MILIGSFHFKLCYQQLLINLSMLHTSFCTIYCPPIHQGKIFNQIEINNARFNSFSLDKAAKSDFFVNKMYNLASTNTRKDDK